MRRRYEDGHGPGCKMRPTLALLATITLIILKALANAQGATPVTLRGEPAFGGLTLPELGTAVGSSSCGARSISSGSGDVVIGMCMNASVVLYVVEVDPDLLKPRVVGEVTLPATQPRQLGMVFVPENDVVVLWSNESTMCAQTVRISSPGHAITQGGQVSMPWPHQIIAMDLALSEDLHAIVAFVSDRRAFAGVITVDDNLVTTLSDSTVSQSPGFGEEVNAQDIRLLHVDFTGVVAVTSAGASTYVGTLSASVFQTFWETPREWLLDGDTSIMDIVPMPQIRGGALALLRVGGSSLQVWCGTIGATGAPSGNTFELPVDENFNVGFAAAVELGSGTYLLAYSGPGGGSPSLRFARPVDASDMEWGVAADPHVAPGLAIALSPVPLSNAFGMALFTTTAGLVAVGDFPCDAMVGALYYNAAGCDNAQLSSRCVLSCSAAAVGSEPLAMCRSAGGFFEFQGCAGPSCFLPQDPPEAYTVSACDTSDGPLKEDECGVECSSGTGTAIAVCQDDGGTFEFGGCVESECVLPEDTRGYITTDCDTFEGPIPSYMCTVSCAEGYAVGLDMDVEAICFEGQDTFELSGCFEMCSAPGGIVNAADPACASGTALVHASSCDARCLPGYSPTPPVLRCLDGVLQPRVFECREESCEAPTGIADAISPACEVGQYILPGSPCITQCKEGFQASVDKLHCAQGVLTPESFSCHGLPCTSPVGISNSLSVTCAQGSEIKHGGNCTTQCATGFSATPEALQCEAQSLHPTTFICGKDCTALVNVDNAADPSCVSGIAIHHGDHCVPQCVDGYTVLVATDADRTQASVPDSLLCSDGEFDPPRFTCVPDPCHASFEAKYALDPPCHEGTNIGHGGICTPRCVDGHSPNVEHLHCSLGVLDPPTFECSTEFCEAPTAVAGIHPAGACVEGNLVSNEGFCTLRCNFGYVPSVEALQCLRGLFQPSTFQCSNVATFVQDGVSAAAASSLGSSVHVVCFLEWEQGLVCHKALSEHGSLALEGGAEALLESTSGDFEALPGALAALPGRAGEAVVLYLRRPRCSEGNLRLAASLLTAGPDGRFVVGQVATQDALAVLSEHPAFSAASIPGGNPWQIVAVAGGAVFTVVASGGGVSMSAAVQVLPDDEPDVVAVCALDHDVVLVTYLLGGCAYFREGRLSASAAFQWVADSLEIGDGGACLNLGPMALEYVGAAGAVLASGGPGLGGTLRLSSRTGKGVQWSPAQAIIADVEVDSVACAALPNDGGGVSVAVGTLSGHTLQVRWFLVEAAGLIAGSALAWHPDVSVRAVWALSAVGPREVAVACASAQRGWGGMVGLVSDLRCSLPNQTDGYDVVGCSSSTSRASHCAIRCEPHYAGTASATCAEDGGTFSLQGCRAPCAAPSVELSALPPCLEGSLIARGKFCTTACQPGFFPTRRNLYCPPDGDGERLDPTSFTCLPLGCSAPTCVEHALSPTCSEGWHIRHDTVCSPRCESGYAPSVPHMVCRGDTLDPPSFSCYQLTAVCIMPTISGATSPPCLEGDIIVDGGHCTALCEDAERMPTAPLLHCKGGVLEPPFFECASPCLSPSAEVHAMTPPCAEGLQILQGSNCTVQCQEGYKAEPESLLCDRGTFIGINGSYKCVEKESSCPAPQAILHLNAGTRFANTTDGFSYCQEGPLIPDGQVCNTLCAIASFSALPEELLCNDGALLPDTFICGRMCDAFTSFGYIEFGAQPACVEGAEVRHGGVCNPRCIEGYQPSAGGMGDFATSALSCYDGTFTPSTYVCEKMRDGCAAPGGIEEALAPACEEGEYIERGAVCTPVCNPGFMPDADALLCGDDQLLTPPTFECVLNCVAPADVENGGHCLEGSVILHGASCAARCSADFLPTVAELSCAVGVLSPLTFECRRFCTAIVGVTSLYRDPASLSESGLLVVGSPACEEGDLIEHGTSCTPLCVTGYAASETRLDCVDGALYPSTFECVAGRECYAPRDVDASFTPACEEGEVLSHNSSCTPVCSRGHMPSVSQLACWNGKLEPSTFVCNQACEAPVVRNAPAFPCVQGQFVAPGGTCDAMCAEGFSPDPPTLLCLEAGEAFLPVTFTCGRDCEDPAVPDTGEPSCSGVSTVPHAGLCVLNCMPGLTAVGELTCSSGTFVGIASCESDCASPPAGSIPHAEAPACLEGSAVSHGGICTTRCETGHVPFMKTLSCSSGTLAPEKFECFRSALLVIDAETHLPHVGASDARIAVHANGRTLVVTFAAYGDLASVMGEPLNGDTAWTWGTSTLHRSGLYHGHNFFGRVSALGSGFIVVFCDEDGRIQAQLAFERLVGLQLGLRCEQRVWGSSVDELEVQGFSDGLTAVVAFVVAGRASVRVGHRQTEAALMLWGEIHEVADGGVAHFAMVPVKPMFLVMALQAFDAGSGTTRGSVRVAQITPATLGALLGPVSTFYDSFMLHLSVVPLPGDRFVIGFQDADLPHSILRAARVMLPSMELEWGPPLTTPSLGAPATLVQSASGGDSMVLAFAASTAAWFSSRDALLSEGGAVEVSGNQGREAPVGTAWREGGALILYPQDLQTGTVRSAATSWLCSLPDDVSGYDVSDCDTGPAPLTAGGCILSCASLYTPLYAGIPPHPECPPPPAEGVFRLHGCAPESCPAPSNVVNAAVPGCAGGVDPVAHGERCVPQCLPGYHPDVAALSCSKGTLDPLTFVCLADCCVEADADGGPAGFGFCAAQPAVNSSCQAPPEGAGVASPSCQAGGFVRSGDACSPHCHEGFEPVPPSLLHCDDGVLTPSQFTCTLQSVAGSALHLVTMELAFTIFPGEDPAARTPILLPVSEEDPAFIGGLEEVLARLLAAPPEELAVDVTVPPFRRLQGAAEEMHAEVHANIHVYILAEGFTDASLISYEASAVVADDVSFDADLADGLRAVWTPLLQDDPQTVDLMRSLSWVDSSTVQATEIAELDNDAVNELPTKLQEYVRSVENNEGTGLVEQTNDTIFVSFDFLSIILGDVYYDSRAQLGEIGPVYVLDMLVVLIFLSLPVVVSTCFWFTRARGRPTLRKRQRSDRQFCSVYVIPDTHRHDFRFKIMAGCCELRQVTCKPCSCFRPYARFFHPSCWCCCRRRTTTCLRLSMQGCTWCEACCCPCLRAALTWHISGLLKYNWGVVLCCYCFPCIPCFGLWLRVQMRSVFAMPPTFVGDLIAWFCCCWPLTVLQEAVHVDGAAMALAATAKTAETIQRRTSLFSEMDSRHKRSAWSSANAQRPAALQGMDLQSSTGLSLDHAESLPPLEAPVQQTMSSPPPSDTGSGKSSIASSIFQKPPSGSQALQRQGSSSDSSDDDDDSSGSDESAVESSNVSERKRSKSDGSSSDGSHEVRQSSGRDENAPESSDLSEQSKRNRVRSSGTGTDEVRQSSGSDESAIESSMHSSGS